jgi:uncharacterized protein HemY
MDSLNDLHQQAMELAEQAFIARRRDELVSARSFTYRAYVLEKQAAEQSQTEPSRSVLHRSAATLALDCGEYREAERLVASALAGTPPETIANELREVLDALYKVWNWREQSAVA